MLTLHYCTQGEVNGRDSRKCLHTFPVECRLVLHSLYTGQYYYKKSLATQGDLGLVRCSLTCILVGPALWVGCNVYVLTSGSNTNK